MNLKCVDPRKEAGKKEKLSHHDASHRKRNHFVVGERHNGNANEDKLRRKEAGIRHANRKKRKSTTLSLGYYKYSGKMRGRKTLPDSTGNRG